MNDSTDMHPSIQPADSVGYFKFEGEAVADGVIDARSASRALAGIDSAVRFFVSRQHPELGETPLPVPVQIQRGSWIAYVLGAVGAVVTAYGIKAAQKMAENDFNKIGLKDVFGKAIEAVGWFVRVVKHTGMANIRHAKPVWDRHQEEGLIGVIGLNGEVFYVPEATLRLIQSAPISLLAEVAGVVERDRRLIIGFRRGNVEEQVSINREDKLLFADDEDDDEIIFPHLVHGQFVELVGVVTRGNERTNTIGFWHEGRVLTCRPRRRSIVAYKKQLFLDCKISGEIDRSDKKGNPIEKRPKIIFDALVETEAQPQFPGFGDDEEDE